MNQECMWGCACECRMCVCVHHRERKRRDWNLTPLSPASGQQEKQIGWVRMCVLLLKRLICSTHQPSMPCIQPELNLHTTSALFNLLPTCMLLTGCDKNCQNSCHHRNIFANLWQMFTCAAIAPECTVDAPLWGALQQTSNSPLRPSSRVLSLNLSPWRWAQLLCVSCCCAYTAAQSSRGRHSWHCHTSRTTRGTTLTHPLVQ